VVPSKLDELISKLDDPIYVDELIKPNLGNITFCEVLLRRVV